MATTRRLWISLLAGFLSSGASMPVLHGKEPAPRSPEIWKGAIEKFEARDAKQAPPQDAVLFVGSSSVVGWDTNKWFPDMATINRGFGGSQICDSTYYADVLVTRHKPRAVVFYAGDNDIAAGKSAEQVHEDFREFLKKVRQSLPETPVIFITIKPSLARWKLRDAMQEANRLIAGETRSDKHLTILDVWPTMLGADGLPKKEIFREDGLHMNDAGYKSWSELLRVKLQALGIKNGKS